ncbi:putative C4-dicarboxylate sensor kinase [Paenibacillus sp. J31TS4]|uniref:ATP-binding protein n=1 Tax=Paenibacillus sp. J31TS4 TaxID=2807195 RepID=UPI001B00795D|nr:sensor histidine kinase [Paenibacillus sp. J31TS4]GIP39301.1 putative C4-dicarboxylate sensor kinase [Paenibacillus sp. J31TS4]
MRLSSLRMNWKIAILSFGIVTFSLLISGIILLGSMIRLKEEEIGRRVMITARTVAELPDIRQSLETGERREAIAPVADRIRVINDMTYIVVMDMDRVRLSHPVAERIGDVFRSEDAEAAFAEHTFQTKAKGEQGTALRGFVPVMNSAHEQVGVVMAGRLLPTTGELIADNRAPITLTLLLSLLFGVWGSWKLAGHIKKQMFDLEPAEIARVLEERTAAFHAMHEGVIAIDMEERITIFNDKAKEVFGITGDVIGRSITEIIPDSRLPEILRLDRAIYNQEIIVGNKLIWSNRVPMQVQGRRIGALAIFQDRTEVAKMAEELTGVRAFVDALRVQNHEHRNKLHTIAGLLQLEQPDKALAYLFDVTERQEQLTRFLTQRISDASVSGLLLSKVGRGKELGIEVKLDPLSKLEAFPSNLDHHDLVLILGNVLENAFDALERTDRPDKEVFVSLAQDEQSLSLLVEDNGIGMDDETRLRMTEKGFSTKAEGKRGYGMHLVSGIVRKGGGELTCESVPEEGTSILITFARNGGVGHDGDGDSSAARGG